MSNRSTLSCPRCRAYHVLGEFEVGQTVRVRAKGNEAKVIEWSQLSQPLYYHVEYKYLKDATTYPSQPLRENVMPCQIELAEDLQTRDPYELAAMHIKFTEWESAKKSTRGPCPEVPELDDNELATLFARELLRRK